MNSPVIITADITGSIIGISPNNTEYGYIRVEQKVPKYSKLGWLTFDYRSALLKGTLEDLKEANLREGDHLPGKIVIKESLTPFNNDDPDKDYKIAGDSGVICTLDDQPIYRRSIYTTIMSEEDELIQHNNGDVIREQIALQKENGTSTMTKSRVKRGMTL